MSALRETVLTKVAQWQKDTGLAESTASKKLFGNQKTLGKARKGYRLKVRHIDAALRFMNRYPADRYRAEFKRGRPKSD